MNWTLDLIFLIIVIVTPRLIHGLDFIKVPMNNKSKWTNLFAQKMWRNEPNLCENRYTLDHPYYLWLLSQNSGSQNIYISTLIRPWHDSWIRDLASVGTLPMILCTPISSSCVNDTHSFYASPSIRLGRSILRRRSRQAENSHAKSKFAYERNLGLDPLVSFRGIKCRLLGCCIKIHCS